MSSPLEDFHASLESIPNVLKRKYALIRDLDKSSQEIQRQNEERCEREIEIIKQSIRVGIVRPDSSLICFSEEALDEQKHSLRIVDEKIALAIQAYDLVDNHVQQLDQYLRKANEEQLQGTKTGMAASGTESGRGRRKTRVAAGTANPTAGDLDLPIDPNEPTYCFCNRVSFGEMVACDNPECIVEWFHFECVGLKEQPRGKWYCPECTLLRKKGK